MAGLIRGWRKTGHTGRDRGLPTAEGKIISQKGLHDIFEGG
jgi:hypothetical protein